MATPELEPSSDSQRTKFVKMFRSAQKVQETGEPGRFEFSKAKPNYVLAVESVQPIRLGGVAGQPKTEGRVIRETVCALWKFYDNKANRIVQVPICDGVTKSIPAKNWACYVKDTPMQQGEKVKHLLKCAPEMCLNRHELKALIGGTEYGVRGTLKSLYEKGQIRTDTSLKFVFKKNGKLLSWEELRKIPPSKWTIEPVHRQMPLSTALRRQRRRGVKTIRAGALACFRAPKGLR